MRPTPGDTARKTPQDRGNRAHEPPLLRHLQNFLIEAQEGKLKISATDLETSITSWTTAQGHPGAIPGPSRGQPGAS